MRDVVCLRREVDLKCGPILRNRPAHGFSFTATTRLGYQTNMRLRPRNTNGWANSSKQWSRDTLLMKIVIDSLQAKPIHLIGKADIQPILAPICMCLILTRPWPQSAYPRRCGLDYPGHLQFSH